MKLAQIILIGVVSIAHNLYANRPADEAAKQQILFFGNSSEPPSLDPHINSSVNGSRIINCLMEGLIAYHRDDDNIPEPGVAESWEHDGSYRVWTFNFREDARWSNGDSVTANDFVYSYNRMLNPELGARYAQLLYAIKNAQAYNESKVPFSEVGVRAIDEHTLEIELEGPTPHFPNMVKHASWFPVHPATIEAAGGMVKQDSNWTRENYIGNGAFTLKEWSMNKVIIVEKNPLYWDAETVRLKEVHFFPTENANTDNQRFDAGSNHYVNTIPSDLIPTYIEKGESSLRVEPYLGTYFYRLNTQKEPLNDVRVRRALTLAINQRAIVRRITKGGQTPAHGYTPPGISGYKAPELVKYNPREARDLLAEAGFPGGEGFPKLTLIYNTSEAHRDIAIAIQQMWKSILGIDIDLRNQEWKVFLDTVHQGDYDIARAGWIGDYMYPDTFLFMWTTGNGNNETGWSNEEYDQLISASYLEADAEKRLKMLYDAETILLEEMPIAPIYFYTRNYRLDTRVRGWNPKLLDNHPFKHVYFEN
jgi:oligopeptide transport system substrate-binding protein